jgi:NAD-dependent dihydropyrimidine dehydrogenase PreA subunit
VRRDRIVETTTRAKDPEKARRAAAHPDRPGSRCDDPPGSWRPIVDHDRCQGKRDCVVVCPYDVFEVRRIEDADWQALSWLASLKVLAHRYQTAYTPRADHCRGCGLCVVACPERAITLSGGPSGVPAPR